MKVSELMTRSVLYCAEEANANTAAQLMWENDLGAIPIVCADSKLVGIVTDRDICVAAYTQGLPLGLIRVASAMARRPACLQPDDDLSAAHRLMRTRRLRRLPVVDDRGKLSGILTVSDLARAAKGQQALEAEVGRTLAAISAPGPDATAQSGQTAAAMAVNSGAAAPEPGAGPQSEAAQRVSDESGAGRLAEPASQTAPQVSTLEGSVGGGPSSGRSGPSAPPPPDKPEHPAPRAPSGKRRPRQR